MENTEDKIQNLRDGRVATMTTDTDASLSVPKNETKEDTKPNVNLLKRIDELTRERVNAFETQQRKLEEEERRQLEKKLENAQKTEVTEVTEIASSKAEQVDEESVSMPKYIGETELQTESVEDEETQVQNHHEPQNHGGFGGIYRRWGVFRRRYSRGDSGGKKMHKACELFVARPH